MIEIHFPDKTIKSYEDGVTPIEIAQSISEGLARNVLSAEFNGETVEANTNPLDSMAATLSNSIFFANSTILSFVNLKAPGSFINVVISRNKIPFLG